MPALKKGIPNVSFGKLRFRTRGLERLCCANHLISLPSAADERCALMNSAFATQFTCSRGDFTTCPILSVMLTYDFQLFWQIKRGILANTKCGYSNWLRLGGLKLESIALLGLLRLILLHSNKLLFK